MNRRTPEELFDVVQREQYHLSRQEYWVRHATKFYAGFFAAFIALPIENSLSTPQEVVDTTSYIGLASFVIGGLLTVRMAPHTVIYQNAARTIEEHQNMIISEISASRDGEELAWVADFIEQSTEDLE